MLKGKTRRKTFFIFILFILLSIIIFQIKAFHGKFSSEFIGEDFAAYWASGCLLLEGDNPYSAEKLFILEKSIGWTRESPLIPYNPPWGMAFILPFCLKNYEMGKLIWLIFHLLLIFVSSILFLRFYLPAKLCSPWMILVVFTFAPIHIMLIKGQVASLVLLGIILFLWLERTQKFFLAGFATILIAVKPHIVFLFWPILILWIFTKGRWSYLIGWGFALFTSLMVALFFNRSILAQYLDLLINQSPSIKWATHSIGTLLRIVLQNPWLQFFPAFLGILWIFLYWRKYRNDWVWSEHMPFVLLASLISAVYVWAFDFVLLLPAIIQALAYFGGQRKEYFWQWPILAYVLFYGLSWFFLTPRWQFWYLLMPPAFLIIYIMIILKSPTEDSPIKRKE